MAAIGNMEKGTKICVILKDVIIVEHRLLAVHVTIKRTYEKWN